MRGRVCEGDEDRSRDVSSHEPSLPGHGASVNLYRPQTSKQTGKGLHQHGIVKVTLHITKQYFLKGNNKNKI